MLMNKEKSKKLILIDLDGVLNTYTGGFDENFIPPPIQGAKEFIKSLSKDFYIKNFYHPKQNSRFNMAY